eukprot:317611_1
MHSLFTSILWLSSGTYAMDSYIEETCYFRQIYSSSCTSNNCTDTTKCTELHAFFAPNTNLTCEPGQCKQFITAKCEIISSLSICGLFHAFNSYEQGDNITCITWNNDDGSCNNNVKIIPLTNMPTYNPTSQPSTDITTNKYINKNINKRFFFIVWNVIDFTFCF